MGKRILIRTFGCQMNKLDSELVEGLFRQRGYDSAASAAEADVILVNTCSVRGHAEERAYSRIGDLAAVKRKNPGLLIGVIGCMAEKDGFRIFERAPHVDLVCGPQRLEELPRLVEEIAARKGPPSLAVGPGRGRDMPRLAVPRRNRFHAFVAIMRGCDNFCSYCVVPYLRGREMSRAPQEITEEVRGLVADGCVEVALLGQNVNSYGKGLDEPTDLAELCTRLNKLPGLRRIRFVTSHPKDLSRRLIEAMRDLPKVCEYLHLPAQSGSDRVLEKMNRRYTATRYRELVAELREAVPDVAVASDFIVGFPGETEEDFEKTRGLVRDVRFQNCFIFKYSTRPGTTAAKLPDDVPARTKKERNQALLRLQEEISRDEHKKQEGSEVEILVEGKSKTDPSRLSGRTRQNEIVVFEGSPELAGKIIRLRIVDSTPLTLFGRLLNPLQTPDESRTKGP